MEARTLHEQLNSSQMRQAVVAALLGHGGRGYVRINGSDVPTPEYLRMMSRLCGQVADETESAWREEAEFSEVQFEQELGKFGKGTATRITNTRTAPFAFVCHLDVTVRATQMGGRESKEVTGGSGVLISPCHVLTAAHVLRSKDENTFKFSVAERVLVSPARDESTRPFGQVNAKSWKIHPKWDPDSNLRAFDYAVITLEKQVSGGCFWGSPKCSSGTVLGALPASVAATLLDREIATAGYPETKKLQMWSFTGAVSSGSQEQDASLKKSVERQKQWATRSPLIFISADAEHGQSGSPVWVTEDGKRYLVGILVDRGKTQNTVVAVNDSVVRQLQSWMKSEPCEGNC